MILYVRYPNMKVDYVNALMVGHLIKDKAITAFFRPSELQWVDIEHGPVRKDKPGRYTGVERRGVGLKRGP
jgi:hypothetical protein